MMKRILSLLTVLVMLLTAFALAETEDGDDSNPVPIDTEEGDDSDPIPVDVMDDDELGITEQTFSAQVLKSGDKGDDVQALQERLKELNYYSGKITGKYDEKTVKAVKEFQKDFVLEETGEADLATLSLIFTLNSRPLRYGSSGEDVTELQKELTALGYYKGKISGNFLEQTKSAVEDLQKKNGLKVTRIADSELMDMIQEGRILSKTDKPDDTNTPAPALSNYLVDENEDGVPIPDEPVVYKKRLQNGSKGTLVKEVQKRLKELGYYEGDITGNYKSKTINAVRSLQKQNGMETSGVVNEETWNLIFNDAHVVLPGATPRPTPEPTPVPFHIVVDVANQVTSVYGRDENGEYTVPVRQMLCSTGMKATPSDVGDWVLNGRHATWCIFPKWGNSYARYWTRINGSIAFHSPIYTAVSNSAMKISSYKMLGQRASHGCIRLAVWDAKWIYDNVGAGTVVSIVEGMDPDPELRDALKLPPLDKKYCTPISTPVPTAEPEYSLDNVPQLGKRQLKENSQGEDVYWLQKTLKDLGYYDTKVTGKMLKKTVKAVKAFQQDHGLRANGGVNQELMDLIAETARNAKNPQETPAPIAMPAP